MAMAARPNTLTPTAWTPLGERPLGAGLERATHPRCFQMALCGHQLDGHQAAVKRLVETNHLGRALDRSPTPSNHVAEVT
jgi:hypothetical protein